MLTMLSRKSTANTMSKNVGTDRSLAVATIEVEIFSNRASLCGFRGRILDKTWNREVTFRHHRTLVRALKMQSSIPHRRQTWHGPERSDTIEAEQCLRHLCSHNLSAMPCLALKLKANNRKERLHR